MLGYELSIRCICGQETKYTLNALRYPVITLGRKQEPEVRLPDINICSDEHRELSRFMLYFAYNQQKQDWYVGAGFPIEKYWGLRKELGNMEPNIISDPHRINKQQKLFYFPKDKLFTLLDRKFRDSKDFVCDWQLEGCFAQLNKEVPLSEIAGIGLMPCSQEKPLNFNQQTISSVYHPLLGNLPFGWYIEVNANRSNKTVIKSYIEKSIVVG